ncbi:MAG: putative signal transducing protein [Armatimonadota bacterium]
MGDRNSKLQVVFDAPDEVQAVLYRSLLEEAGIDVVERPLETDWFEGVRQQGLHSQLLVREEDAPRAAELVAAFRQEAEEGDFTAESLDEAPNSEDNGEASE